jgi:hypothetical protein
MRKPSPEPAERRDIALSPIAFAYNDAAIKTFNLDVEKEDIGISTERCTYADVEVARTSEPEAMDVEEELIERCDRATSPMPKLYLSASISARTPEVSPVRHAVGGLFFTISLCNTRSHNMVYSDDHAEKVASTSTLP